MLITRSQCDVCKRMLQISKPELMGTRVICPGCQHEILLTTWSPSVSTPAPEAVDGDVSLLPPLKPDASHSPTSVIVKNLPGKKRVRRSVSRIRSIKIPLSHQGEFSWNAFLENLILASVFAAIGIICLLGFNLLTGFGWGSSLLILAFFKEPMMASYLLPLISFGMTSIIVGVVTSWGTCQFSTQSHLLEKQLAVAMMTFLSIWLTHFLKILLLIMIIFLPSIQQIDFDKEMVVQFLQEKQQNEGIVDGQTLEKLSERWDHSDKLQREEMVSEAREFLSRQARWMPVWIFFSPAFIFCWIDPWEIFWMIFASFAGAMLCIKDENEDTLEINSYSNN